MGRNGGLKVLNGMKKRKRKRKRKKSGMIGREGLSSFYLGDKLFCLCYCMRGAPLQKVVVNV
jgi:hypothetical protein